MLVDQKIWYNYVCNIPQINFRSKTIPFKNSAADFVEISKLTKKFNWNARDPEYWSDLKKQKHKSGWLIHTLLFQNILQSYSNQKKCSIGIPIDIYIHEWNKAESSKTSLYIYDWLIIS